MVMVMADAFRSVMKPEWALLIRVIVLSPLSSHTSARKPVGKQFDRKPTPQGSRHLESPPTGNLERYDNRRNACPSFIRHLSRTAPAPYCRLADAAPVSGCNRVSVRIAEVGPL
jgi:hypothetical protein